MVEHNALCQYINPRRQKETAASWLDGLLPIAGESAVLSESQRAPPLIPRTTCPGGQCGPLSRGEIAPAQWSAGRELQSRASERWGSGGASHVSLGSCAAGADFVAMFGAVVRRSYFFILIIIIMRQFLLFCLILAPGSFILPRNAKLVAMCPDRAVPSLIELCVCR